MLIQLAKELYNPLDLARVRNLRDMMDQNEILFDVDYERLFDGPATQVAVQLSRIVKGSITQLGIDILRSS